MLARDWQMNGTFSAYTGTPFTVTASGASLNAPGNGQTADQIKTDVEKLGNIGRGSAVLRSHGVPRGDGSSLRNFRAQHFTVSRRD
jgi:hypothetical protein